jgi:RND family efflux transporter MFP subunit
MVPNKSLLAAIGLSLSAGAYFLYSISAQRSEIVIRPSSSDRIADDVESGTESEKATSDLSSSAIPDQIVSGHARVVSAPRKPDEFMAGEPRGITAFTEPYLEVAVAASEMGTIAELRAREGQMVRKGDVLAVMEDDVLQASLAVAKQSSVAQGALNSALADVDLKRSELAKLQDLRERNHASQKEVGRVEAELKIAEARLLSVQEDLEVKQLEVRRIEAQLEQRVIRAPMDGILTEVLREVGEYVSPSDSTIVRLIQLDPLLIVFSVPLNRRNEFSKDQKVQVAMGPQRQFVEGVVEYVSPTPDSSNSSVRVKVRISNSSNLLQSGEAAELIFDFAPETTTKPSDERSAAQAVALEPHETAARQ